MTLSPSRIPSALRLVVLALLLGGSLLVAAGVGASGAAAAGGGIGDGQTYVTICHRTSSHTNPYNEIAVADPSVLAAHADHAGPVFAPGVDDWGDIIPPVVPGLPDGLNWPEGRDVLENGCEVSPDVGPLPSASVGDVECDGTDGQVTVMVGNADEATEDARFAVHVDGQVVARPGPVAPGGSETVVVDLSAYEDQTVTVEVTSGDEVVASHVVTVDCTPAPEPGLEVDAQLTCEGQAAVGSATVTNHGQEAVVVTAEVAGQAVGQPVTVPPGATRTATADLSAHEDQPVTVDVLVDGEVVASYDVTPDCVPPVARPVVAVGGQVCPPPLATVTLGNDGDPASSIVFSIRVDGRVVQRSAPLYGGDTTTIVVDLTPYEDRTVEVELLAEGEVLGSRSLTVDCARPDVAPDQGAGNEGPGSTLPEVGAATGPADLALGGALVLLGALLVLLGWRGAGSRS